MEQMKEIKRCPEYYVTPNGRVFHKDKLLTPIIVGRGYMMVCIYGKKYLIHRLVAECFLDEYNPQYQVHHKDGDITNNNVNNLECISQKDHLRKHKLKNPLSKKCEYCGNTFYPAMTHRKTAKFCNRECYKKWKKEGKNDRTTINI